MSTMQQVQVWNERAGKSANYKVGSSEYWDAIDNQVARIKEEVDEFIAEVKARNLPNMMKELCDVDVVTSGMMNIIGGSYEDAINVVLRNNEMKLTAEYHVADSWRNHHTDKDGGAYAVSNNTDGFGGYYCVKRLSDDKVMKPPGHPKPDIDQFCPEIGEWVGGFGR